MTVKPGLSKREDKMLNSKTVRLIRLPTSIGMELSSYNKNLGYTGVRENKGIRR